jgi:predicted ATP-dependent serine protease
MAKQETIMQHCPSCGHERDLTAMRCPECGSFYSKVIELIEQEAAAEEQASLKGRWRRVIGAADKRHALAEEYRQFKAGLTLTAKFTLWVIVAFVFALVVTVL